MAEVAELFLISIFTLLVISYLWARLFFFQIDSTKSRRSSYLYDPVVAIQILTTYYFFISTTLAPHINANLIISSLAYSTSLFLFWWAVLTCKTMSFAMGGNVRKIITHGPFGFCRHPFYTSYTLTWIANTFLFPSYSLSITLAILAGFYWYSARTEENLILKSKQGHVYKTYKSNVGMFIPKATQWRSWFSALFQKLVK